jgi:hypothetical protein
MSTGSYVHRNERGLSRPCHAGILSDKRPQAVPTFGSFVTLLCSSLTFGLAVLMLAVLAIRALLYPAGYPDPFAPYEVLNPGAWAGIVRERYPCKRQLLAPVTDSEPVLQTSAELSSCAISPDSGPIGSVIVVTWQARIREVQFLPTNIQVIELVRRWGRV